MIIIIIFSEIKQDIRIYIYVAYSQPNGWTDWVKTFCGHSRVAGGCLSKKIIVFFKCFFDNDNDNDNIFIVMILILIMMKIMIIIIIIIMIIRKSDC